MGTRARKGTSSVGQAAQGVGAGRHPRSEPGDTSKPPRLSAELEALLDEADEYAEGDLAARTREAYARHWAAFAAWCREHGVQPLPAAPQVLRGYLVHRSKQGCRVATLSLDLSAVVHEHKAHGFPDPTGHPSVSRTWLGIRKKLGTAQTQKAPATTEVLRQMLETLPEGLLGQRALLALGFAPARDEKYAAALYDAVDRRRDLGPRSRGHARAYQPQ